MYSVSQNYLANSDLSKEFLKNVEKEIGEKGRKLSRKKMLEGRREMSPDLDKGT